MLQSNGSQLQLQTYFDSGDSGILKDGYSMDQVDLQLETCESGVLLHWPRMWSWRIRVPAADAKKAESASVDTIRTPRPPSLTGRVACTH
jgi:hypothetical protein